MDYLIIFLLFLAGGLVFFAGMALFLIIIAYLFSLFTGKKIIKPKAPKNQEPSSEDKKPLKIA